MYEPEFFAIEAACYSGAVVRGSPNPRYFGLALRLRTARKRADIPRVTLATRAGVSDAIVRYLEADERMPTVETIARLASALSLSAAWLAFGLGEQDNAEAPASCDGMADRLRTARADRNQTRIELARSAELNPGTIAKIEEGGQTGVDTLEKLAKALRVSPAWLAFGVGPRELPPRRRAARVARA